MKTFHPSCQRVLAALFVLSHWVPVLLHPSRALAAEAVPATPAVTVAKISFTLPKESYVTIVIDDENGNPVRRLAAEEKLPAGKQELAWDGTTDSGGLARPGNYKWRGLYRDALKLEYQFSAYTAGANPPWFTTAVQTSTSSGWLSDHNPPLAVCAAGDKVFIGTITSEAGQDIAAVDLEGKKLWGISHPFGVGAKDYAYDGKFVYAVGEGQWAGPNGFAFRINPQTFEYEKIWTHKGYFSLRGLAVHDGKLYLSSDNEGGRILVYDVAGQQVAKEIPLPKPGGLAFTLDGRLLAISNTGVVVVRDDGSLQPLIAPGDHLTRPNRMAIAADGSLFISDGPTSWYPAGDAEHNALYGTMDVRFKGDNQVKVFNAAGKFLRAIGTPGGRTIGKHDPQAMRCPVGVAIDTRGRLWVAEWDMLPKRISVWTPDGKLVREFIGAHKYGGGGALDPGDRNTMIYDGMLFGLDWAKGDWHLDSTIVPIMNADPNSGFVLGGYAQWPDRIIRYRGHEYFVAKEAASGTVWMRRGDSFVPVAHVGPFRPEPIVDGQPNRNHFLFTRMVEVLGDKAPGSNATDIGGPPGKWNQFTSFLMLWNDANGDGVVQPAEVDFSEKPHYWLVPPYIGPDLTMYIRNPGHRGSTSIWRLPPARFTAEGAPVYDIARLERLNQDFPFTNDLEVDPAEHAYVLADAIYGYDLKTSKVWNYPSPWGGFGSGAPRPKPGLVVSSFGLRGTADAGGAAGPILAVNSNYGQWYLFTSDGLFLSTIFGDTRTAPYWGTHFKEAVRGMDVNGISLGQESFNGWMGNSSDGSVYIVAGHPHCSIVKVVGLDSVQRFAGTVQVPVEPLLKAARASEAAAVAARQQQVQAGKRPARALPLWTAIETSNFHPAHSMDVVAGRFPHVPAQYGFYLGYDPGHLVLRASMPHFANHSGDLDHLFVSGDAVVLELGLDAAADPNRAAPVPGDLRVVVAMYQGKPVAVLYNYRTLPGVPPKVFQSPGGKVTVGQISLLKDATVTVEPLDGLSGRALAVTAHIPWKALVEAGGVAGLPEMFNPQVELRGDAGFVMGNSEGTMAVARVNWANPATGVVGDVAEQARLVPRLWGVFNPQPKPVE